MLKDCEYNNLAYNLFGDIITYKQTIFFQNLYSSFPLSQGFVPHSPHAYALSRDDY